MLFWIVYIIIWLPTKILFPTRVIGKKNLVKTKSIYACNHQSLFDISILVTSQRHRLYALGKKELFNGRLKKWFFTNIGCISVNRGEADIGAVKKILDVLKNKNKPLVIFPSGTRKSTPDEVNDLKNGTALFALKANAPLIPMVFLKKPRIFRFNKLVIGEPLDLSKYNGVKPTKAVLEEVSTTLSNEIKNLIKQHTK